MDNREAALEAPISRYEISSNVLYGNSVPFRVKMYMKSPEKDSADLLKKSRHLSCLWSTRRSQISLIEVKQYGRCKDWDDAIFTKKRYSVECFYESFVHMLKNTQLLQPDSLCQDLSTGCNFFVHFHACFFLCRRFSAGKYEGFLRQGSTHESWPTISKKMTALRW